MSSLKEKLAEDFKTAMKNKDTVRKTVVQMVRSGVLQIEKDEKIEADDNVVLTVLEKEVKKRNELIAEIADERPEAKAQAELEISILEEYLPEQLSDDEVKKVVEDVIAELGATSMKDMGSVMKDVLSKLKGQADGSTVSKYAKELLS